MLDDQGLLNDAMTSAVSGMLVSRSSWGSLPPEWHDDDAVKKVCVCVRDASASARAGR